MTAQRCDHLVNTKLVHQTPLAGHVDRTRDVNGKVENTHLEIDEVFKIAMPVLGILFSISVSQERALNSMSFWNSKSLASGSSGPYQPTTTTSDGPSLGDIDCPCFSTSALGAPSFCVSPFNHPLWPPLFSGSCERWNGCGSCDGRLGHAGYRALHVILHDMMGVVRVLVRLAYS